MLPQGTWAATAVNQQEPEFEYGMFTFPGDKEGGDYTIGAADLALSISADTEHPEESKILRIPLSSRGNAKIL